MLELRGPGAAPFNATWALQFASVLRDCYLPSATLGDIGSEPLSVFTVGMEGGAGEWDV